MPGLVTAGIRLVAIADTAGFQDFQKAIRDLRINFLGFDQIQGILTRTGQAVLGLGRRMVSAFGGALEETIKLDDALTRIVSVSDKGVKVTVDDLRKQFMRLSDSLPISAAGLAEVGVEVARAGVSSQAAIQRLALVSTKLGAISDDLTEVAASTALARIANNFGVTGDAIADFASTTADSLSALAAAGPFGEAALVNVTNRASKMAKVLGLNVQELMAFSASLLATGTSSEVAGTALDTIFAKLLAQPAAFANAAGVSAAQVQKLIASGQGFKALDLVFSKLNKRVTEAKDPAAEFNKALSGLGINAVRQRGALLSLIQRYGALNDNLKISRNAVGELDRRYRISSGSLKKVIATFRASIENLAASMLDVLIPAIVPVLKAFTAFITIMANLPSPVKVVIVAVAALATATLLLSGGLLLVAAGTAATISGVLFLRGVVQRAKEKFQELRTAVLAATAAQMAYNSAIATTGGLSFVGGPNLGALSSAANAPSALFGEFPNLFRDMARSGKGPLSKLAQLLFGVEAAGTAATGAVASMGAGTKIFSSLIGALRSAVMGATMLGAALLVLAATVVVVVALKDEIVDLYRAMDDLLDPVRHLIAGFDEFAVMLGFGGLGGAFIALVRIALFPVISAFKQLAFAARFTAGILGPLVDILLFMVRPIVETIGRFVQGFRNIGEAADRTFKGLLQHIDLATIGLLVLKGIVWGLMLPFVVLGRLIALVFDVIMGAVFGLFEGLARAFGPVIDEIVAIGEIFQKTFDDLAEAFAPVTELLVFVKELLFGAASGFDLMGIAVQAMAALVRIWLFPILLPLRLLLLGVKLIAEAFQVMGQAIRTVVSPIFSFFQGLLSKLDRAVNLVKTLREFFSDPLKFFFESFGELFNPFTSAAKDNQRIADLGARAQAVQSAPNSFRGMTIVPGTGIMPVPHFTNGGITTADSFAQLHANEAVIPLSKLPEIARQMQSSVPAAGTPARAQAASESGGSPVNLSLTIPVTLTLGDLEIGNVIARVSDEEIRRQFGSRGIRLAGIG